MPYYNKLTINPLDGKRQPKTYMIPSFVSDVTILPGVVGGVIELWLQAPVLVERKIQTIKILRMMGQHRDAEYETVQMGLKEAKFHVDVAYDIICDYAPELIPEKPQLP